MNEDITGYEKIMFDIAMQLYDEFNDKLCEINDHLGDVYSYRDLEDVEKAEKEREIVLLRNAVKEQEKVIDEMAYCISKNVSCLETEFKCVEMKNDCKDCIKQYFINKVKENNNGR